MTEHTVRNVQRVAGGRQTSDGAGVKLYRLIGTAEIDQLDPFLLLDEFKSDNSGDYIAGFPSHPHRGFETVTYMMAGLMRHEDSTGTSGTLKPGGAQWMTAGRGIIHSEMPQQEDGLLWGFQLWVNLPADSKMTEPRYQDIEPDQIPEIELDGGARARIVAGAVNGVEGPVKGIATDPIYLDVSLPAGARLHLPIPRSHNAFSYVYEGEAAFGGGQKVAKGELAIFGDGDTVEATAASDARFLLVAGRALNEPVARYGPFVMNTPEQIEQAIEDYRSGAF